MLKFVSTVALTLSFFFILWKKFLKLPLDSADTRRKVYPTTSSKRSHPTPQTCWHSRLKIQKKLDGTVDDGRLEKSLNYEKGYYTTWRRGSTKIFWQSWRPKRLDKVTHGLIICHGYGDHCDYGERQKALTFAALNEAWVFSFDIPGHGRSDGLWGYISDWKLMIAQIAEVIEEVFFTQLSKLDRPTFCFGTSQGGAIAIHLCMQRPELFKGLVLACPMCDIADEVKPPASLTNILVFLSKFGGKLPVMPITDHRKLICKNPEEYERQRVGPHRNLLSYSGKPRMATARELLFASLETIDRAAVDLRTPFLIVHGDCDYVCPIEKSKEFYEKAGVKDKTFKEIPGGWHFLFDPIHDSEKIWELFFSWINERIN